MTNEAITPLYIGADETVSYEGARRADDETIYLNSGTCTWELKDANGTSISTGSLTYVAGSNGNYLGVIDRSVTTNLTNKALYYVSVTFSDGTYEDFRRITCRAAYRGKK